MSETLGQRAPRLAAISARALGWSPATFWGSTPAELAMSLADPASETDTPLSRNELDNLLELERHGHR